MFKEQESWDFVVKQVLDYEPPAVVTEQTEIIEIPSYLSPSSLPVEKKPRERIDLLKEESADAKKQKLQLQLDTIMQYTLPFSDEELCKRIDDAFSRTVIIPVVNAVTDPSLT
jgi:hypothetical protein